MQVLFDIPNFSCIMQLRAENQNLVSALSNYQQILYQFFDFTQNLKQSLSFLLCLIYALISFGLMLLIGSLKYVFYDYMYSNFTFTFSIFIESLGDRDSLFVSIGTLISFFIGEIVEYINNKSNS